MARKKEIKRFSKIISIEELIDNKHIINLFNSIFKDKIEKLFVNDLMLRTLFVFPVLCFSFFVDKIIDYTVLSSFFSFALIMISISVFLQGHLVFNNYVFQNKKSNIPFIRNIMERYFLTHRMINTLIRHYKKLSPTEKILLNSISIPKTGCDFYLYNLQNKLKNSKPKIVFKYKDIISLAISNIEDRFIQQQVKLDFNKKIKEYELLSLEDLQFKT